MRLNSLTRSCLLLLALVFAVGVESRAQTFDFSKNSTRKIRVTPSPTAARIGSAINWRDDVDAALVESQATGKPVFWYVPTLRGTFMDRKDSVDRYMMAGPFSWPQLIQLINDDFIPVKSTPAPAAQQAYNLRPYAFVEPGFVILNSEKKLLARVDRLTTLNPSWLFQRIANPLDANRTENEQGSARRFVSTASLKDEWQMFAAGKYQDIQLDLATEGEDQVERKLLAGMVRFRLGDHEGAKQVWSEAAAADPESPLAWKAAAEAEGFGPFVRGFEIFRSLPAAAFEAGLNSPGSAAPAGTYQLSEIWDRSLEYLLGMQRQDGAWVDSDYDFGGTDSLPNVHAAVTALAGLALLKGLQRLDNQSQPTDPALKQRIESAIKRATDFLIDNRNLNLQDRDELFWAFAYRVRFLAEMVSQRPELQAPLQSAVNDLQAIQANNGYWFHEYPNPFVTATALVTLHQAEQLGMSVDSEVISKGIAALQRDRFGNGAFTYSAHRDAQPLPTGDKSKIAAAAGRMPLCELALLLKNSSSETNLIRAIEYSFELSQPMLAALKYDDHTSNFGYGGFFFWFDIEKRALAINRLSDPQQRSEFNQKQLELILSLVEIDGCFVDSHELGRVYGTAMALISLAAADVN